MTTRLCCFSVAVVTVVTLLGWVHGAALDLNVMTDNGDDTAVVGSSVREVRAAVPKNIRDLLQDGTKKAFVYTYGDDDGDDKSYLKRSQDDGNSGYKHFDSYHKKDGDKYGYAKHSAYGKGQNDKADATNEGGSYSTEDEVVAKNTKRKSKKAPKQTADGTKHTYKVIEELDDDEGGHYTDGEVESEGYTSADEGSDDSGHYTDGEGESNSEGDSEHYEAQAEGGDDSGDAAENEHYEEGHDGGAEAEGYTNYEDGDGESEHYEAEADEDDY